MINPYSPPVVLRAASDEPLAGVSPLAKPATALIVMSAVQSVIWSNVLISYGVTTARGIKVSEDGFGLLMGFIQFVTLLVICIGAANMARQRSLRWAWISAVLACVPGLSPFFVLGIPFGAWSAWLLRDERIRIGFGSQAS
ncbi:MAG: hypothetical protein AAF664_24695 [Planctomycetota bacterium]